MDLKFDYKTMVPIRKVLRKEKTRVISLIMFFENIKEHDFQGVKFSCLFFHGQLCIC